MGVMATYWYAKMFTPVGDVKVGPDPVNAESVITESPVFGRIKIGAIMALIVTNDWDDDVTNPASVNVSSVL